jgi:hypothetical protein
MLMPKEELSVEVTEVDSIEIDDVNFAESCEDEVLEEFAANTSSAYHQYLRL